VVRGAKALLARVDAAGIEQVLTNLLDNAIAYSPEGGAIHVDLTAPAKGTTLVLSVRDRGIGICVTLAVDKEHLPRLTRPARSPQILLLLRRRAGGAQTALKHAGLGPPSCAT